MLVLPSPVLAACNPTNGDCPAGIEQIESVMSNIVSASVGLAFIATFVMLIVAGIKYLTSGGDQKAVASAHQTATWAIMGVLILALAWITLQLLAAFTHVESIKVFDLKKLCGINQEWCQTVTCDGGEKYNTKNNRCEPLCGPGETYDPKTNTCP